MAPILDTKKKIDPIHLRALNTLPEDVQQWVAFVKSQIEGYRTDSGACEAVYNYLWEHFNWGGYDDMTRHRRPSRNNYEYALPVVSGTATFNFTANSPAEANQKARAYLEDLRKSGGPGRGKNRIWGGRISVHDYILDMDQFPDIPEEPPAASERPTLPTGDPSPELVEYKQALREFVLSHIERRNTSYTKVNPTLRRIGVEPLEEPKTYTFSHEAIPGLVAWDYQVRAASPAQAAQRF